MGGRERGLSNRFPVSTAQSLRHHSIVCFTTQFFRHCLAARLPPQCRVQCADDSPKMEINLPGFEISVDVVSGFFSAATLRSSNLVLFGSFEHSFLSHPFGHSSIIGQPPTSRVLLLSLGYHLILESHNNTSASHTCSLPCLVVLVISPELNVDVPNGYFLSLL